MNQAKPGGRIKRSSDESQKARYDQVLLAAIVESSYDAIITNTLDGTITSWNPAAERLYGYRAEEVVGQSLSKIFPSDRYGEFERVLEKIRRGERVDNSAIVQLRKGATWVDVSITVSPIKDSHGRVVAALTIAHDITEPKHIKDERERLLAELESTIESIAEGIISYDLEGTIIHMNPAAAMILGLSREERKLSLPERMAVLRIETPDGEPFPLERMPGERALRGETVRGIVFVIHRRRDSRLIWISSSAAPIRTPDGKLLGAVMVFTDITAQQELQQLREDFVRTISHDLRSPLGIVLGQAQLIQRYADRVDVARKSADAIVTSARRMNAMIEDLVDSVRLEAGQLQLQTRPVDLRSFVLDLLERAKVSMDVGRIKVDIPSGLPPVAADPDELERILSNLLSNALKYSSPDTEVLLRSEKVGAEAVTSVIDRGQGIAPEDLPHIFERFYQPRTGRARGGLGLGLYITKMLIDVHGGSIWVESVLGKGSTFYFALPLASNTSLSEPASFVI